MEEQACLVNARSDSEASKIGSFGSLSRTMAYTEDRLADGAGEPGATPMSTMQTDNLESNETGELIDYNECSILAQFHEDAIRQAGFGIYQCKVLLAVGLAVMGATLELTAMGFVLPSAEIELCILPHQKKWLVSISLLGASAGSLCWAALAGRRRVLQAALAVHALFSAVAAVMPTYGTAMMARFCSAVGAGGVFPLVFAYAAESASRAHRMRMLCPLIVFMALGILYASAMSSAVGEGAPGQGRQHFSAWHRYLLVCTLPTVFSLISLMATLESPRYLLHKGRLLDAADVYKNIHSSNQIMRCFKKTNNVSSSEYRLSELALPDKRHRNGARAFWQSFFQLFSLTNRSATFALASTLMMSMGIQWYLSAYTPAMVSKIDDQNFDMSKRIVQDETVVNKIFNETLENVNYVNATFVDSSFRDMLLSHVTFVNCTFLNVTLANVKTAYTRFDKCTFVNSSIIECEISRDRELSDSTLTLTPVRGAGRGCAGGGGRPPHLQHHGLAAAGGVAGLLAPLQARRGTPVILSAACVLLSPTLYFASSDVSLYVVEALYRFLVTLIMFEVTLTVVESYPAGNRCIAHGLFLSVSYLVSLATRELGTATVHPVASCVIVFCMSLVCSYVANKVKPVHSNLL